MDLRRLDELAAAATASPIEAELEGWRCKAAPDLPFRRCNVATPPADAADDRMVFADGLDQVRRWYHAHGLRLVVQVSDALAEADLVDSWLEREGLGIEAPVHVMTATGRPAPASGEHRVEVTAGIDEDWAEVYGTVFGGGPAEVARTQAYGRMLAVFGDQALGASCRVDDTVVGVGYGVLADGWLGVFGVGTSTEHRRHGIATAVSAGLRRVALARGADRAYLQVETGNAPAIGLYGAHGFRISHGYHYRSEPHSPA